MFKNYLKVAFRNLMKKKIYFLIGRNVEIQYHILINLLYMKKICKTLGIIIIFLATTNLSAQQIFKDSGQSLGNSFSTDVKLGDLDCDGDLDAAVANPSRPIYQKNEIWLNDGTGIFSKKMQQLGSSSDLKLFDIDQDGDLDLFENESFAHRRMNNYYQSPIRTWLNDGEANFTLSDNYSFEGIAIAFDKILNKDNQYEAITIESSGIYESDSTVLRIYSIDNSTCKLEKELIFKNFSGRGIATGDLNSDGYSDLVMYRIESDYILLNDKKGGFLKSSQELSGIDHTLSVVLKDLNGDGFLDILQSNYHSVPPSAVLIFPAKLYLNDGIGRFTESLLPYNSYYLTTSVAVADMDNDGDQDIYINHGNQISGNVNLSEILINDGHTNFTSKPALKYIKSVSVAFGDLDNDGDLDMFLACAAADGPLVSNRIWFNTIVDK